MAKLGVGLKTSRLFLVYSFWSVRPLDTFLVIFLCPFMKTYSAIT